MSTRVEILEDKRRKEAARWQKLARTTSLFVLFLLCAIAVFVFGSNYYSIFPTNKNLYYEGGITAMFLAVALISRSRPRFHRYWQVFYAFFVAAAVILVASLLAGWRDMLFRGVGITPGTNFESAAGKLFEALVTITLVLSLSRFAGMSFASLYVQRGNPKWGLILGIGVLLNFATSALMFFASRYSSMDKLGSAILWGLIFALANGFLEELWLRSQFLRKLIPLLGLWTSILLLALWWSLFHLGSVYLTPVTLPFFLMNLLTFGLAYGYAMHKTDSWIAPGMMHAASDFFLFLAMLGSS